MENLQFLLNLLLFGVALIIIEILTGFISRMSYIIVNVTKLTFYYIGMCFYRFKGKLRVRIINFVGKIKMLLLLNKCLFLSFINRKDIEKYDKYFYSKVDEMIEMNLDKTIKVANKTKDSILKISNKIESIAK